MKYTILLSSLLFMAAPDVSSAQVLTSSQREAIQEHLIDVRVAADQETGHCRQIGNIVVADLLEQVSGRASALISEVTPGFMMQDFRRLYNIELLTLYRALARHPDVLTCQPSRVRALLARPQRWPSLRGSTSHDPQAAFQADFAASTTTTDPRAPAAAGGQDGRQP